MIEKATQRTADIPNVTLLLGDFLTTSFDEPFDFVCAISSLHHTDFEASLQKAQTIVRPGGVLAVVGMANGNDTLTSRARGRLGHEAARFYRWRFGESWAEMPVNIPEMTYKTARTITTTTLPGARFRKLLFFRYFLHWRKPLDT
jgi:SAM-dependent methyltransferase